MIAVAAVSSWLGSSSIATAGENFDAEFQSIVAGGLLEQVSSPSQGIGIAPEPVAQTQPLSSAQMLGSYSEPPEVAEFHITNGPRASQNFTGHHCTTPQYTCYREQPDQPKRIWVHFEWGPKMSTYKLEIGS